MNGTRDHGRRWRCIRRRENELAYAGAWISAGLLLAAVLPAQTNWVHARLLEPRSRFAMAWDAARQRAVLFGGYGVPGDTWESDGVSWIQRSPVTSPIARYEYAMAYDAARQRVVLFGGRDNGVNWLGLGDTWEWDGLSWLQRNPAVSPVARHGHAMVYDALRQRIVLFGGLGSGYASMGDTWEWDGMNWVQRSPAASPTPRQKHAMVFDAARQRVVLFGGGDNSGFGSLGDTWEWDGVSWVRRNLTAGPSPRWEHAMAYDAARQRAVLFGGFGSTLLGDTWEWDGSSWALRNPAASAPPSEAMAYDAARQRVVVFGESFVYPSLLGDTSAWDGVSWARRNPVTSPPARRRHAMAYDVARQRIVLFGGGSVGSALLGDTWEWDGVNWAQRSPAASPPPRIYHAMAYDAARQRVVLFGGSGSSLFGDTWEWDGVNWTQRSPAASPSARAQLAMAYDAARQRVVLFGGGGFLTFGDTWEWDGVNWVQRNPTASPIGRLRSAMAYDAARQRVVLFGGLDNSTTFGDTWEWDGVSWVQRNPAASPIARYGSTMAYDAARQQVVLFGGAGLDTWLYGNLAPAATQTIGSACAGTNGPPVIASNLPFLGNQACVLDLLSARASAPCLFMLATGTQALNLGGGCTLYLSGLLVPIFTATNVSGFASVKLAIPLDPSLRGGAAYAQGFVIDPMGSFGGLALSAGLKLVLGD